MPVALPSRLPIVLGRHGCRMCCRCGRCLQECTPTTCQVEYFPVHSHRWVLHMGCIPCRLLQSCHSLLGTMRKCWFAIIVIHLCSALHVLQVWAMLAEMRIDDVSGFDLSPLNVFRWHPQQERVNLDKYVLLPHSLSCLLTEGTRLLWL